MLIELEDLTEFYQFQPWLNSFCSKEKFPKTPIIFSCFPKTAITLYSQYNAFLSPWPLPNAEALDLKPPMGIACLFLTGPYELNLPIIQDILLSFFKSQDTEPVNYAVDSRGPRFDLHALDSEGTLLSIYCQGISLDFLFKPSYGLIQVACTKYIPFKQNTPFYMLNSLDLLKELIINDYSLLG